MPALGSLSSCTIPRLLLTLWLKPLSLESAMQRTIEMLACAALLVWSLADGVLAESYPSKPIKIIVPAVAGSPPDVRARWLAERLYPALGQRVVIENKPGAGGIIGAAAAA